MLAGIEVIVGLDTAVRPVDGEFGDFAFFTESEEECRLVGGEVAGGGGKVADLGSGCGFQADGGVEGFGVAVGIAEFDGDAVFTLGIITIDAVGLFEVDGDEVGVAIAIEVSEGRGIADALVIEAPVLTGFAEFLAMVVAVGAVKFATHFAFFPEVEHVFSNEHVLGEGDVAVVHVAGNSVGEIDVLPAVEIVVGELDGPGPVGAGDAEEFGGFVVAGGSIAQV